MSEDSLSGDIVIDAKKKKAKREKKPVSEFSSTKLSVKNLPDEATNEMLSSVFGDCPGMKTAFVVTEKKQQNDRNPRCTGNGFVQFGSEADCKKALAKVGGERRGVFLFLLFAPLVSM